MQQIPLSCNSTAGWYESEHLDFNRAVTDVQAIRRPLFNQRDFLLCPKTKEMTGRKQLKADKNRKHTGDPAPIRTRPKHSSCTAETLTSN